MIVARSIEHRSEAQRRFVDVIHILDRHAGDVLERATDAADAHSVRLVLASDRRLPDFDQHEPLLIVVGDTRHRDEHASLDLRWSADRRKRLLANVDARLELRPLGGGRRTEVVLRANYRPHEGAGATDAAIFGRRVVAAALERFHHEVIRQLENYEESFTGLSSVPEAHAS